MAAPIYQHLANRILKEIEAGVWRPGDRLPSEVKLAELEGLSLGTVQKGLNHLADQGVLIRRHGKGTYVANAETPAENLRHFRFLGHDQEDTLPVASTVLSIERVTAPGPWSGFLGAEDFFVMLQRRLDVNGEFSLFSEIFLSGPRFEGLLETAPKVLDGVLIRDHLSLHFNCPTLSVEQRVRAVPLPPRVCGIINVPCGTAGLLWELLARSYRDQPAVYQRVYVPPSDRPLQILGAT